MRMRTTTYKCKDGRATCVPIVVRGRVSGGSNSATLPIPSKKDPREFLRIGPVAPVQPHAVENVTVSATDRLSRASSSIY